MSTDYLSNGYNCSSFDIFVGMLADNLCEEKWTYQLDKKSTDSITNWNQENDVLIDTFNTQVKKINEQQNYWIKKSRAKLEEVAAKIIQIQWRK